MKLDTTSSARQIAHHINVRHTIGFSIEKLHVHKLNFVQKLTEDDANLRMDF